MDFHGLDLTLADSFETGDRATIAIRVGDRQHGEKKHELF
jgi:hypothetical protein